MHLVIHYFKTRDEYYNLSNFTNTFGLCLKYVSDRYSVIMIGKNKPGQIRCQRKNKITHNPAQFINNDEQILNFTIAI